MRREGKVIKEKSIKHSDSDTDTDAAYDPYNAAQYSPVMSVISGALALRNTCGCRSGYFAVRLIKVFTVDSTAPGSKVRSKRQKGMR